MRQLKNINWLTWLGVAVSLLILVRIFPPLLPIVLLTLGLLIIMIGVIAIPMLLRKKKRANSLNGNERIEQQIKDCQLHILKLEQNRITISPGYKPSRDMLMELTFISGDHYKTTKYFVSDRAISRVNLYTIDGIRQILEISSSLL